jgi:hypothetical protein
MRALVVFALALYCLPARYFRPDESRMARRGNYKLFDNAREARTVSNDFKLNSGVVVYSSYY